MRARYSIIITIALLLCGGGILFAVYDAPRVAPTTPPAQPAAAPAPSPAPLSAPAQDTSTTASTTATSSTRTFSGLVSSIWDDHLIVETTSPLPSHPVVPQRVTITPATIITDNTASAVTVGTFVSGSGTQNASGTIIATRLKLGGGT